MIVNKIQVFCAKLKRCSECHTWAHTSVYILLAFVRSNLNTSSRVPFNLFDCNSIVYLITVAFHSAKLRNAIDIFFDLTKLILKNSHS